jgi:hypothetical protein
MRILMVALLATALSGCVATYTKTPVAMAQVKLKPGATIAVATPRNGAYGDKTYTDSGAATANAVRAAFARYAGEITVVPECQIVACLREKAPAASYLAVPEILHWEDRATEWSGKKDKLEIKLSIYAAGVADVVASTVLAGKSKWATFGGDHPQDLLTEPLTEYVGSLY